MTLEHAYRTGRPLVVFVHGHLRSAVVAAVFTDDGVWYTDDGCLDPMPSYHVQHFVRGAPIGSGPWRCGDAHVFDAVAPGDASYGAWRKFIDLVDGDIAGIRCAAERRLHRLELERRAH